MIYIRSQIMIVGGKGSAAVGLQGCPNRGINEYPNMPSNPIVQ